MSQDLEKIFQALGNKTRLDIVKLILAKKEISCQGIMQNFNLSQPTMSHHFSQLIDTDIIKVRKVGVSHVYSLNRQLLERNGIYFKKAKSTESDLVDEAIQ
ncbi:hypothetical protein A2773_05970 [Candidatus Gottesmanbacteria bacterium RIFCSPHIGHO2_01_FULL_39_10]|uniref:HTH arsR-type domain-containing protein n=1 Tax=Candidatus Gottesmanbacteria bacterium RIFCSPHIGHO2_01_FULL_39_10 TaxID=1798375 RepID=A0A1F5ZM91_9BACT|nr:MAG: hypothetical protein A2773_05970 [Candidatus Gottesmanbacteria bacterium RIFCSPHIGHO2_01_FULL_39_10]